MNLAAKWTLFFSIIVSLKLSANSPYSIPRSNVVELTEQITKRVYPVIYVTDANYTFPIVAGAMRLPVNSNKMQEAIIVAIGYEKGSAGSDSRIRDYTPSNAKNWKKQTGSAQNHVEFMHNTVFSFIESNYRASRSKRTYIGHSLGGLFGAYILFTAPDLFSHYIIGSPSVWFNDNALLGFEVNQPKMPTKVYISVGSQETPYFGEGQNMVEGASELALKINSLNNKNITLKRIVIEGANHATAFPTTAIRGLDWVFGKH
jgi:predicted alpha/beta superfamily hydrolase